MKSFCLHLGWVIDFISFNPSARVACNPHALRQAQNVCVLTKVGPHLHALNTIGNVGLCVWWWGESNKQNLTTQPENRYFKEQIRWVSLMCVRKVVETVC